MKNILLFLLSFYPLLAISQVKKDSAYVSRAEYEALKKELTDLKIQVERESKMTETSFTQISNQITGASYATGILSFIIAIVSITGGIYVTWILVQAKRIKKRVETTGQKATLLFDEVKETYEDHTRVFNEAEVTIKKFTAQVKEGWDTFKTIRDEMAKQKLTLEDYKVIAQELVKANLKRSGKLNDDDK